MAALPKTPGIVYRLGSATPDNCTPRQKDLEGKPGQAPGLSTFETLELKPGQKAQVIDLKRIVGALRPMPDKPELEGGVAEHITLAPFDETGNVDLVKLQEWAATRGTGCVHEFTKAIRDAIIDEIRA
jgi:hypothetical protein